MKRRRTDGPIVDDLPRYNSRYHDKWAFKFSLAGNTNAEIAQLFGVPERTFEDWMQRSESLKEEVAGGREYARAEVVHSVYRAANGYSHTATKIMQYEGSVITHDYTERFKPDIGAAEFFLTNRDSKRWKKKTSNEVSGPDGDAIEVGAIEIVIVQPKKA